MDPIDIELVRSDQSANKRVLEVYEILKQYREADARQKWIERRKKAWEFIENELWTDEEEKEMTEKASARFKPTRGRKQSFFRSAPGIFTLLSF